MLRPADRAFDLAGLILVRHAPTAWSGHRYCGSSDPPLSTAGRSVAARVAADLAQTLGPATRIVSSPARRARSTADAIAAAAGIAAVTADARWCEADFGIAEGLTFDDLARLDPDLAARLAEGVTEIDWPGGERAEALARRVSEAWRELVDSDEDAIVVSHAGPLRIAIALATGVSTAAVDLPAPASVVRFPRGP